MFDKKRKYKNIIKKTRKGRYSSVHGKKRSENNRQRPPPSRPQYSNKTNTDKKKIPFEIYINKAEETLRTYLHTLEFFCVVGIKKK